MDITSEIFDQEKIRSNPAYSKFLNADEKILYSGIQTKINKFGIEQSRLLLITNQAIYNIEPNSNPLKKVFFTLLPNLGLKRRIIVKNLKSITLSTNHESGQFILHCQNEYDYRYIAGKDREIIIRILARIYEATNKQPIKLYLKTDTDLWKYCTNDDDFKEKKFKEPKTDFIFVKEIDILNIGGIQSICVNRNALLSNPDLTTCKKANLGCTGSQNIPINQMNPFLNMPNTMPVLPDSVQHLPNSLPSMSMDTRPHLSSLPYNQQPPMINQNPYQEETKSQNNIYPNQVLNQNQNYDFKIGMVDPIPNTKVTIDIDLDALGKKNNSTPSMNQNPQPNLQPNQMAYNPYPNQYGYPYQRTFSDNQKPYTNNKYPYA